MIKKIQNKKIKESIAFMTLFSNKSDKFIPPILE